MCFNRKDPITRHRVDFVIREIKLMGPRDLRAKEIANAFKLMGIYLHIRTVERIIEPLRIDA